jgi:hypothetical protein
MSEFRADPHTIALSEDMGSKLALLTHIDNSLVGRWNF